MSNNRNATKLAKMIVERQEKLGLSDRHAAELIGTLQQTYSSWKHGIAPSRAWHERLCEFLDISIDDLKSAIAESKAGAGRSGVIRLPEFYRATTYGVVTDATKGEFYFEPVNVGRKSIPEGKYVIIADTSVMEPSIHKGAPCWVDNTLWPAPGNDVIVHTPDGGAIIGNLVSTNNRGVKIKQTNPERVADVADVMAIHTIVLTQRVVTG